jgi:hypothetical protein
MTEADSMKEWRNAFADALLVFFEGGAIESEVRMEL